MKVDSRGDAGGSRKEAERADYSIVSSIPYYPDYVPPPPAKKEEPKASKKQTKVVMKVPICCEECEELVESALYRMKGVQLVECNSFASRKSYSNCLHCCSAGYSQGV